MSTVSFWQDMFRRHVGQRLRTLTWLLAAGISFYFFPSENLFATTIVGLWTQGQITIAADSKQTLTNRGRVIGSRTACKIHPVRSLAVALAGLAETEEVNVVKAIKESREFRDSKTGKIVFDTGPVVAAQISLERVLASRDAAAGAPVFDPKVGVSLIIGGAVDGELAMARITYTPIRPIPNTPETRWSRFATSTVIYPQMRGYAGTNPDWGLEVIGISDAISRFQRGLATWGPSGDDIGFVTGLVEIEAGDRESSQFVGLPISTIVIDENGPRWISKGACEWDPILAPNVPPSI
jgi:hypothetical protein